MYLDQSVLHLYNYAHPRWIHLPRETFWINKVLYPQVSDANFQIAVVRYNNFKQKCPTVYVLEFFYPICTNFSFLTTFCFFFFHCVGTRKVFQQNFCDDKSLTACIFLLGHSCKCQLHWVPLLIHTKQRKRNEKRGNNLSQLV